MKKNPNATEGCAIQAAPSWPVVLALPPPPPQDTSHRQFAFTSRGNRGIHKRSRVYAGLFSLTQVIACFALNLVVPIGGLKLLPRLPM